MIKVLIVEDELYTRKGLIETTPWEECSCTVVGEARDGAEGLRMIEELSPDLVITDVRMPRMSGIEMIKFYNSTLKGSMGNRDIAFIILSGHEDFHYAQKAISLGVKEYLLKPIDDNILIQSLQKMSTTLCQTKTSIGYQGTSLSLPVNLKADLYREISTHEYHPESITGKSLYLKKAIAYIERNYIEGISIKDVAQLLAITESYLSRIFKSETNHTFLEYLSWYRIKKACELMKEEDIRIYQIAELVGFEDSCYFSSVFKKYLGKTPTEVRNIILS